MSDRQLADPTARYTDLGSDFYDTRINPERRKCNHIRQLEALGYKVTSNPRPDRQDQSIPAPLTLRRALPRAR